ncbi:MAG: hypothetical protein EBU84_01640 [Actinobacteria bacterium]|nr:hypothetical protein [Actinomycetota bacterium]
MQGADKSNGIVLCGVCKNVVNTLPVIRAAFEELASKAGVPCWAVFYENNSDDGTDRELMKWASEAPDQVRVQCDKFTQEEELSRCVARTYDNRPCRMEQIAHARNKLLAMLEGGYASPLTPSLSIAPSIIGEGGVWGTIGSPARYVVMIDMDNPVPFPVNAILRCIARDPDGFDALICNGLNPMGYMYDTYAYRDAQFAFGPEIMREAFWSGHHQYYVQTAVHNKTLIYMRQMKHNPALLPYIPVASGFNGLCIFRREALMGGMRPPLRYSAVPTPEMNAEYEAMNCIPPLAKNGKTHVDGASAGIYLFPNDNVNVNVNDNANHKNNDANNKGIFYFHNSGYNFPVVCEHVPFFAAMRARNRRRIYLCTDLVWNWM